MNRYILFAMFMIFSPITAAKPKPDSQKSTDSEAHDSDITPVTNNDINSPKEPLRAKLFAGNLETPACKSIKVSPRGNTTDLEQDLDQFLQQLLRAIQIRKETELQPLFHPRLNVSIPAIVESFAKLDSLVGSPFEASVYRLWAFNTVDGSPSGLKCSDDALTAFPQYGYPLQFGLWLQVLGKRELGRIYVSIVPADGKWNIGAFHTQQWTHFGKDFLAWAQEGEQDARKNLKEAAYVKLDIAQKLLDTGSFIEVATQSDIVKARDALMTKVDWDQSVRKPLAGFDIIYTGSLLVLDGAGILARVRVPGEISVVEIKESCKKMAQNIRSTPWGSVLGGMRCNFNLPREDSKQDGVLGGIYLSFSDLK